MSHTAEWTARLHLSEEERRTEVRVDLDTGSAHLTGSGTARCNPVDTDVPAIGDELAAARALEQLAAQLKRNAYHDMEAAGNSRKSRIAQLGWPEMTRS
ncbi:MULTISPECIES: dsRBD fold-containing protein [Streptomyces]|uniref:DUF1876 domain-containing protein n=1 Tax=Streptomyces xanthii TaxID=2768069 RepID=A0A7H1BHK4_9ACTN|nr:dsRBD fold-containing protein [Streptomyces xanthii]QNS08209.1 DUF1876 domain-containing protein [Streptomyces xanthii]